MTYPAVDRLLPHRAPALLLREILRWEDDEVSCSGAVPSEHPLASNGEAPIWLALEVGAQAGAVLAALLRNTDETEVEPRVGYLVGMRGCTLHAPAVPVGDSLEVRARRTGGAGPLALFAIEVRCEGGPLLATGQVSAYAASS